MTSMLNRPVALLPADDYDRLHALAQLLGEQMHPLAPTLLRKLDHAEWRAAEECPEKTVVLDGFVTYRFGDSKQIERRLLIDPADGMWPPAELSVTTPLGITLLGQSVGDRMSMIGTGVRELRWVEVVAVDSATGGGIVRRLSTPDMPTIRLPLADHPRWPKNGRRLARKGE